MKRMELRKSFQFEAAHLLPKLPKAHKCRRLHGHSFAVEVVVAGERIHRVDFGSDDRTREIVGVHVLPASSKTASQETGSSKTTSSKGRSSSELPWPEKTSINLWRSGSWFSAVSCLSQAEPSGV